MMDDPLLRIHREISEVVRREHELKNGYNTKMQNGNPERSISPDDNNNNPKMEQKPAVLQRALSTSHLPPANTAQIKRFPDQRGLMQRFIKSRGRLPLSTIKPVQDPTSITWSNHRSSYDTEPKPNPIKMTRKGYVPVEERIQRELREMQNRETELRAHRRKVLATSSPNLLAMLDSFEESDFNLVSPPSTPKLRSARSFALLCDLDDSMQPSDTVSAPPSLRPAISLAKLCDDTLNEEDVPKSKNLIAKFESIIQQNKTSAAGPIVPNGNHL